MVEKKNILVSDSVNLVEYLSYVYEEIQKNGFTSWKDYKINKNILPTSHLALLSLEKGETISPDVKALVKEMILYFRLNSTSEETLSLVARPRLPKFRTSSVAALMQLYLTREDREEKIEALVATSQYVGNVGDVGTFDLFINYKNTYGKNMSKSNFYLCLDSAGNSFLFSSHKYVLEDQKKYRITARVMAHEMYNGIKQTRLGFIEKAENI